MNAIVALSGIKFGDRHAFGCLSIWIRSSQPQSILNKITTKHAFRKLHWNFMPKNTNDVAFTLSLFRDVRYFSRT